MLRLEGVSTYYGPIQALKEITLEVEEGAVVAVLGANGAGKTTLMNTISGLLHPRGGQITFEGRRIDRLPTERIVRLGIIQVPEGRQLFPDLTVAENLRMGAFVQRDHRGIKESLERVFAHFPVLMDRRGQLAGTLSGGEQQMLAIARALMARPRLLLLDEPSLGLSPILVRELFTILRTLNGEGTTMVLAEQNSHMALTIARYGYILETGRIGLAGKSEELRANKKVKQLYLGIRERSPMTPRGGGESGGA
ncbi:MAG: ABC transporter ATP-binding protein [Candidatus Acetothermia bacterium]|nr:ABC transporter ATP-binding protein [Candidatus Acetothermia bacterium]MDH7504797.1 ABC transporter ATP-binding protein [Candidatus Acetothermia bacterium]